MQAPHAEAIETDPQQRSGNIRRRIRAGLALGTLAATALFASNFVRGAKDSANSPHTSTLTDVTTTTVDPPETTSTTACVPFGSNETSPVTINSDNLCHRVSTISSVCEIVVTNLENTNMPEDANGRNPAIILAPEFERGYCGPGKPFGPEVITPVPDHFPAFDLIMAMPTRISDLSLHLTKAEINSIPSVGRAYEAQYGPTINQPGPTP